MLRLEQTGLDDYLIDPEVREKASQAISRYFDEIHLPKQRKPPAPSTNNRFPASRNILRGLIFEPIYQIHFTAQVSGDSRNRYYLLRGASAFCEKGEPGRRSVPAAPLERTVIRIFRGLFSENDRVQAIIEQHVRKVIAEKPASSGRDDLDAEMNELNRRQRLIYATASSEQLVQMKELLRNLRSREDEIKKQLTLMPVTAITLSAPELTRHIVGLLEHFDQEMDDACYEQLRLLLRSIIRNFTLDLASGEAQFEVVLPEELLRSPTIIDDLRIACSEVHSDVRDAYIAPRIRIGAFRLIPPKRVRKKWTSEDVYDWIASGSALESACFDNGNAAPN